MTGTTTTRTRRAVAGLVVLGALGSGAGVLTAPAHASGGDDDRVVRTGSCSGAASWKLKAKTDDGRLEVEGEVDSNRTGQTWEWTIRSNGDVVARGTSRTAGRSGSFSVERKIRNAAGPDQLVFRASKNGGGDTCVGRLTF
ncbi:hypothetical protein GCM10023340_05910 [Nocardioides marinquilinus]|uniref:Secreted protein n=1 Tax=Nocardioides marinquilinus TaxID=1210400 RepID=A0ABP9P8K3_9ACTN